MGAFQPGTGAVSHAAQIVGGQVIEGQPEVTRNAKDMTAFLAGVKPGANPSQSYQGIGTGYAKTFAEQLGGGQSPTGEPTGSRSKPFTVELSAAAATNLASQIWKASNQDKKPEPSPLQKFLSAFGKGEKATEESTLPNAVKTIAERNAARMGMTKAMPNWLNKAGGIDLLEQRNLGEKFNALQGTTAAKHDAKPTDSAMKGINLAEKGQARSTGGGFSSLIASPPPAAEAAEAAGAGEVATGLSALAVGAGETVGVVMVLAANAAEAVLAVIGAIAALKAFGGAVAEGNKHLSIWSGQLAIANAYAEIAAIKREAHLAGATSGTSSTLASESNKLAEEFQPIAEDLASVKNIVALGGVEIARLLTLIVKPVEMMVGPVLRFIESWMGQQKNQPPLTDLFDFLEQNARLGKIRNPQAVHGARAVRPGGGGQGGGMGPKAAMPDRPAAPRVGVGGGHGLPGGRGAGDFARIPASTPDTSGEEGELTL